jgi:hypothetical protein
MPDRDAKGRFPRGNGAGKGAGWGGPANGSSASRIDAGEYGEHVRALARDPKHAEAKAALRELYLTTLVQVAVTAPEAGARVAAADKLADRVDGKAKQPVENSGPDGGPMVMEWHIVNAEDRDAGSV